MIKRLIIIGLIFAVVITGIVMFFTRDTNPTEETQRLSARVSTLMKLLEQGNSAARNPSLKRLSSEASVLVLSDQVMLDAAIKASGTKAPDKAMASSEADTDTFTKLQTADINGQFDTVYRSVLTQKLDTTAVLVREVQNKTPNPSLKAATTKLYETLSLLQDRLSKL